MEGNENIDKIGRNDINEWRWMHISRSNTVATE